MIVKKWPWEHERKNKKSHPLWFCHCPVCFLLLFIISYAGFSRDMDLAKKRLSTSGIYSTADGDTEYAVLGEGTPVLLLHGAGGGFDFGLWSGRVFFTGNEKIIAVSRFGYLRTPIPDDASIQKQAARYHELLDHLNITKVVVVGTSAGGASAIQYANDYPENCSGLILISAVTRAEPPGSEEPVHIKVVHTIQQSDYGYWLLTRLGQSAILGMMGVPEDVYARFTPEQKQLAQEMLDVMHPMTPRYPGTINDAKMLLRDEIPAENITCPVLIMHARDDALVNYTHALNAHEKIPDSQLILFDSGGHAMLSQIGPVRENVTQFLGGLQA
jgi:pimeloyl-ACP methyl ester carboxylesterase